MPEPESEKPPKLQLDWEKAGPYIQKIVDALTGALERSSRHTGKITGALLALIIVVFSSLAGYALFLEHVDTAEKLMIALISFLGGAAMFSGSPKK